MKVCLQKIEINLKSLKESSCNGGEAQRGDTELLCTLLSRAVKCHSG